MLSQGAARLGLRVPVPRPHLPARLAEGLVGRLRPLLLAPSGWRGPFLLGLLLSGLPCGLLYGALVAAASAGSALAGALAMAAFALGTVPALVGVGLLGRFFGRRWAAASGFRVAARLLFLLNGGSCSRAMALRGAGVVGLSAPSLAPSLGRAARPAVPSGRCALSCPIRRPRWLRPLRRSAFRRRRWGFCAPVRPRRSTPLVAGLGSTPFSAAATGPRRRVPAPAAAAPDTDFAVRAARPEGRGGRDAFARPARSGLPAAPALAAGRGAGGGAGRAARPRLARRPAAALGVARSGGAGGGAGGAADAARLRGGAVVRRLLRAAEDAEGRSLLTALGVAAFGAANVMLLSAAMWFGGGMGEGTRWWLHALTAAIALPVIAVAGLPFYRGALAGLRAGRATMDLAVSLGVLATAAMSVSEALRNGPYTWFDGATSLLALLLAGRRAGPGGAAQGARRRVRSAGAREGEVTLLAAGQHRPPPRRQTRAPATACWWRRASGSAGRGVGGPAEGAPPALLDLSAVTGEAMPQPAAAGQALPAGAVNLGAGRVGRCA
jgi:hypothetical protein